ncbi:hypothetical protein LSAT2_018282 [Lamellibrachia satsuma]|nr:hypothetical protein LSAT2_018282 [Lamellibrachia satsuma]
MIVAGGHCVYFNIPPCVGALCHSPKEFLQDVFPLKNMDTRCITPSPGVFLITWYCIDKDITRSDVTFAVVSSHCNCTNIPPIDTQMMPLNEACRRRRNGGNGGGLPVRKVRRVKLRRRDKKEAVNSSRTRAAKVITQKEYTAANKEVKKSVKTDKRNFVEGLAQEAEKAAANRSMKPRYNTTRTLAGEFKKSERPIKDKKGSVLMGADKQLNRWAEHFEELLKRPAPQNQPDNRPAETDHPIDCNKPTREEIKSSRP